MADSLRNKVELLAPARNAETGCVAIDAGADAVYIGAARFGARSAAGNSVEDIAGLADYAHRYGARVYVTVNTLLTDDELDEARRLIIDLHNAGADAFIVQDVRIAGLDLPDDIEFHASTQCDIRTADRAIELERMGFSQMVLARELSIDEIGEICRKTNSTVETFIHGALCVSYSGRCYLSERVCGRSANRGECAQMCRLPYDLIDEEGRTLQKGKYLLSLKDFDASGRIGDLLDAGVRSFKIEGRLKDKNYVKNITGYYRQIIDKAISERNLTKSSLGETELGFVPDVRRTFYRGGTEYFLGGKRERGLCTMVTGKAMGGMITDRRELRNGDGVCWVTKDGELRGCQIDGCETLPDASVRLFRNNDIEFERLLTKSNTVRKIGLDIEVSDENTGFKICEKNYQTELVVECQHEEGRNSEKVMQAWRDQFSRLGDTEFKADAIELKFSKPWFVPASVMAGWRREMVELTRKMVAKSRGSRVAKRTIDNRKIDAVRLFPKESMRCRYCIRYELGMCLKDKKSYRGKLWIRNSSGRKFELGFDCGKCEMTIL
ncbi:MAG: U32 family peptidase [Paludibacteraceae bacterium]|nr:U32 family peptidase [Paludibacteraceae bacterium]